jgi:hypothetical protein
MGSITEAQLQTAVLELAALFKWRHYHTHDSRRSAAGFPDLVLVRPPDVLYVELKSDKGRLTPEQTAWLQDLEKAGQEVHIWRPADWHDGTIRNRLMP